MTVKVVSTVHVKRNLLLMQKVVPCFIEIPFNPFANRADTDQAALVRAA